MRRLRRLPGSGCSGCEGLSTIPPRTGEGDHAQHGGGARAVITGPTDTLKRARKLRSEMSLPETILWRELRKRPGGFKYRRQHPAGRYILDFYCAAASLAIEVDGHSHDGHNAEKADAARGHFLRSQGVATLRVPVSAVLGNLEGAVLRIVEVCEERVVKLAERRGGETSAVPLHHPSDGPPPRAGEDLR
jgi:very-short-patch-repair endonuclease